MINPIAFPNTDGDGLLDGEILCQMPLMVKSGLYIAMHQLQTMFLRGLRERFRNIL